MTGWRLVSLLVFVPVCHGLAASAGAARLPRPRACTLASASRPQAVHVQVGGSRSSSLMWATRAVIASTATLCPGLIALGSVAAAAPMPRWLRFSTIPVVAGLLNWATNQLAVKMMFYPLRFVGLRLGRLRLGWQGIVPCKAKSMANRIVDDVMLRLIDVREVFARLPPEGVATALEPLVQRLGNEVALELASRTTLGAVWAPAVGSAAFNATVAAEGRLLVEAVVRDVQAHATDVFDLRSLVVDGISKDAAVLVDLFERCGDKDLRFVVLSGLWLGGFLGLLQMSLWLVWSPWWSLALTGGLVGMVTDQLALKLIFEPVEPVRAGPIRLQGLFLRRQAEVSELFAQFMSEEVVSAPALWAELLGGAKSRVFWERFGGTLDRFLAERPWLRVAVGTDGLQWLRRELATRVAAELPLAVPAAYGLTTESLQLRALMSTKMRGLTSAEFERVLHPVFEEDEWTLILIGTALGAIAGAVQATAGM